MPISKDILKDIELNPLYREPIFDLLKPYKLFTFVDILVVVDTQIATQPGTGFGIGTVIETIRAAKVGCMRFRVDIALRSAGTPTVVSSPSEYAANYTGFRFDMSDDGSDIIDKYEQIWCFGFEPGNDGGADSNITKPEALAASNSELAKLAAWMKNRKGGVFATGDHDYLGASMCSQIPRIGTMRLWTNLDGVPPIGTPDRIDTLRPPNAAYEPGAPGGPLALSNNLHQGDLTVQPIQWHPWVKTRLNFFSYKQRPHPVLCHPSLGPINIMPDHAHEGLCRETGTVPLGGSYNFDGNGNQAEYPGAVGPGSKPEPTVIAYGSTLASPPYNFVKGAQPARAKFPMISVYDGHQAGVGRCATDSTWHHWMDFNVLNLKNAGGQDWDKISRYFINLAVWLNPPGYSTNCLSLSTLISHFKYQGFQEYSHRLTDLELGKLVGEYLKPIYGPCWVTEVIFDILEVIEHPLLEWPRKPFPEPCLSCPPFERIEQTVLGAVVRAGFDEAAKVHKAVAGGCMDKTVKSASTIEQVMLRGVDSSLNCLAKQWRQEIKQLDQALNRLI